MTQKLIDRLRNLDQNDRVRVTLADHDSLTVKVTYVDYVEPDKYGGGYLGVDFELDTDKHEVPTDTFPTELVEIRAHSPSIHLTFDEPELSIWNPETEDGYITDDYQYIEMGEVTDIEVL
jgi:hypothetical protein